MHKAALIIRCVPGRYNLWNHNCGQGEKILQKQDLRGGIFVRIPFMIILQKKLKELTNGTALQTR